MSSFGTIPIDLKAAGINYVVSSANKCLEGVLGFSFIIARWTALQGTIGYARSLCLDLLGPFGGFRPTASFDSPRRLAQFSPLTALCESWTKRAVLLRGATAMPPITGRSWSVCDVLSSHRSSIPRFRASSTRHFIHPQIQRSGSPRFTTVLVTVV